ncbi:Proteasome subunit alpha type-2 [Kappamyces sp. JEL0829]|nr:Proteasome subunit alpha type-2 [Kappamyces sp. JEL0829]
MGPDARVLVDKARKSAQEYKRVYMEEPPVVILVKEVAGIMQEYTQRGWGLRTNSLVSLLLAGTDATGHHLYQVDPSGTYFAWKASAIGKNMVNAKTFLEKRYSATMEIEDAVHTAILTLKEGMDGALSENLIEVGCPNATSMQTADIAAIVLHVTTIVLYGTYLGKRIYQNAVVKKTPVKDFWNDMDLTATIAWIYGIFRIAFLSHMRTDIGVLDDSTIEYWVRTGIMLDWFSFILGGQAVSSLVASLVKTATGAALFDPIKIGTTTVNPEKALKVLRLFILVTLTTLYSCWATLGVTLGASAYINWRRATYLVLGSFSTFISPMILVYFGGHVIRTLKDGGAPGVNSMDSKSNATKVEISKSAKNLEASPVVNQAGANPTGSLNPPSKSANTTPKPAKTAAQKNAEKVRALEIVIKMVTFALYFPTALYLYLWVLLNETLTGNYSAMLASKVVIDVYIWFATGFFSLYLLARMS